LFTACLSVEVEAVIVPQNEVIGCGYRTDVLFGQHRLAHPAQNEGICQCK
jgi:deoxycytidylate deaminase